VVSTTSGTRRIASLDQFRGYTVAGMFVVNFLGGLAAIHSVFKHNNTYFSYADSIMPSFLFAAGFSYRLTILRRLEQVGPRAAYGRAVLRSLSLVLVSLALFGLGSDFGSWSQMTGGNVREFVAKLLKASLWEVLAIIGVCQVLTLPVVAARPLVRVLTMAAFLSTHVVLSYLFNYEFVYGRPNGMDQYWGTAGTRAWDGGFFGPLMWSVPMLGGTLAIDVVSGEGAGARPFRRLAGWGAGLMALGCALSCLTTLYDVKSSDPVEYPVSPVLPPLRDLGATPRGSLLADPPFVKPPPEVRAVNYWMMDKRVVTGSFTLFSTGFAFALYSLFVWVCDWGGQGLEMFRILGQNPLAAYLLHHPVEKTVRACVPEDSPLWWCLIGLLIFFTITMLFIRYLDRHKMFIRL
jgi:predicted acyltransferase